MSDNELQQLKSELKALIVDECDQDVAPETLGDEAELLGGELGLDSLDALQICLAVQKRYGARIQAGPDARRSLASVSSLAQTVRERRTDSRS